MKLYRFASAQSRNKQQDPVQELYFIEPRSLKSYTNPCIAQARTGLGKHASAFSMLRTTGSDDYVIAQLENLRWIPATAEDVPSELRESRHIEADKVRGGGQWFTAEVSDQFIPGMERTVMGFRRIPQRKSIARSPTRLPVILIIVLLAVIWFVFVTRQP